MEFDAYAGRYDDNFMGKGSRRFYRDLLKELEVADGDSVLDVGCGTGYILSRIGEQRNIRGFGLDVSESMIAVAKEKHPEYDFVIGKTAEDGKDIYRAGCVYTGSTHFMKFNKGNWSY